MKKAIGWSVGIVLFLVLLALALPFIIRQVDSIINPVVSVPYEDHISNIEDGITTKGNGGYTPEEIIKQESDPECPVADDQIVELYISDYSDFVIIWYKTIEDAKTIYPNAVFIKTSNGLVYDGVVNVGYFVNETWWGGWNLACNDNHFVTRFDKLPDPFNHCIAGDFGALGSMYALSYSISNAVFAYGNHTNWNWFIGGNPQVTLLNSSVYSRIFEDFLANHFNKYFAKLGNLEIICESRDVNQTELDPNINYSAERFADYMGFYTYVNEQVRLLGKNYIEHTSIRSALINVTPLMVYPLPEDLRNTYPTPSGFDYDYFGVYSCNKFIDCSLSYATDLGNVVIDDGVIVPDIPEFKDNTEYSSVKFKLINSDNSNLSTYNFETDPVILKINNKSYSFDTFDKFYNGISLGLTVGENFYYSIESPVLIFNSYSGNFKVENSNDSIIEFDYIYMSGYIDVEISLNPISDYQFSDIDLNSYPVQIILTGKNDEGVYQFVFDNNNKIFHCAFT